MKKCELHENCVSPELAIQGKSCYVALGCDNCDLSITTCSHKSECLGVIDKR